MLRHAQHERKIVGVIKYFPFALSPSKGERGGSAESSNLSGPLPVRGKADQKTLEKSDHVVLDMGKTRGKHEGAPICSDCYLKNGGYITESAPGSPEGDGGGNRGVSG